MRSTRLASVLMRSSSSISAMAAPSSLVMRWPRISCAPSIEPTARTKLVGPCRVGDAPANVGVDGQRLVDSVAAGIAREEFGPRQVERLQPAVEALHRLHRPGPFEVQSRTRPRRRPAPRRVGRTASDRRIRLHPRCRPMNTGSARSAVSSGTISRTWIVSSLQSRLIARCWRRWTGRFPLRLSCAAQRQAPGVGYGGKRRQPQAAPPRDVVGIHQHLGPACQGGRERIPV